MTLIRCSLVENPRPNQTPTGVNLVGRTDGADTMVIATINNWNNGNSAVVILDVPHDDPVNMNQVHGWSVVAQYAPADAETYQCTTIANQ